MTKQRLVAVTAVYAVFSGGYLARKRILLLVQMCSFIAMGSTAEKRF